MALFKIFNNIDSNNNLPSTYNKGYCYFDATTNKFYIDTAGSGSTTGTRVPLNSKFSDVATTGLMLPYTVCNSSSSAIIKQITIATEGWVQRVGAMIAVYFAHANTAEDPELSINGEDSVPIYKCFGQAAGNTAVESWDAGSIVIFFYTEGTSGSNPGWIMANWNTPPQSVDGSANFWRGDNTWSDTLDGPITAETFIGDLNHVVNLEYDGTESVTNQTFDNSEDITFSLAGFIRGVDDSTVLTPSTAYLPISGGTMNGALIANNSTTSRQVRNITYSTSAPTASDGQIGDIWLVYEP